MLFTYLKIAFRNAFKNKSIAFLNIANLSIGLASAIAVYVVLWGGLSLNSFHEKIDELYQVKSYAQDLHESFVSGATSALLAEAVKEEIPEIKKACRVIVHNNEELIGYVDNNVKEVGIFADSLFLKIFTFPLLYGDPSTALSEPNGIIISQSMSMKLFKGENPLNKSINLFSVHEEKPEVFTITGVFKDYEKISTLNFEYVIPYDNYLQNHSGIESWDNIGTRTFVELFPGSDPNEVGQKLTSVVNQRNPSENVDNRQMLLVPFKNNHLYQGATSPGSYGPQFFVFIVIGIIGMLILMVSVINYVNLSTAWSLKRAKEVGIRKITGAGQRSLKLQFLGETFIIVFFSVFIAVLLCNLGIHYLGKMMDQKLKLPFDNWQFLLGIFILLLITVISSGWIPSSVLAGFAPAKVMKNNLSSGQAAKKVRKFMVLTQFMLAIFLIIATLALKRQVDAVASQSFGFDRYHVVCLKNNKSLVQHKEAFTDEVNREPNIKHITYSSHLPVSIIQSSSSIRWKNKNPLDNTFFPYINVDREFCKTIGVRLKEGHGFRKDASPERRMVIVNDTAARYMGLDNTIGEIIDIHGRDHEIVGIAENFQYHSVIGDIAPLFMVYQPENATWCLVKLKPESLQDGLASLKKIYQKYSPDFPFDYRFLDSYFDEMHKPLFNSIYFLYYSAAFAILIACLGLLGLTMFTTSRKIKEIGVRKVNGAHRRNILSLIMNQFFRQVFIAFLLASPIAFLLVNKILQFFTYQEPLGWDLFALTFILVFLIVLVTVGGQSWRAASRNPVDALRYE